MGPHHYTADEVGIVWEAPHARLMGAPLSAPLALDASLLRLMRVLKLVRKIPQLQMIVMGLIGGLKSIGYIILLLFLLVLPS